MIPGRLRPAWGKDKAMVNKLTECDKVTVDYFLGFANYYGYPYEIKVQRIPHSDPFGNRWSSKEYDITIDCPEYKFKKVYDEYFGLTW